MNCGDCRNICPGQVPLCCDGTCTSPDSVENCGSCGNAVLSMNPAPLLAGSRTVPRPGARRPAAAPIAAPASVRILAGTRTIAGPAGIPARRTQCALTAPALPVLQVRTAAGAVRWQAAGNVSTPFPTPGPAGDVEMYATRTRSARAGPASLVHPGRSGAG
jgi:hypothetical protein